MTKPSDFPGFKELLEEWDKRLKESGFEDIEQRVGNDLVLKHSGSDYRIKQMNNDQTVRDAIVKYYDIIGQKIVETTFTNEMEKKILTMYFEGKTQVEIKEQLKIEGHRCRVYRPIYKWLKKWGLK
jgi:hypothetical protein